MQPESPAKMTSESSGKRNFESAFDEFISETLAKNRFNYEEHERLLKKVDRTLRDAYGSPIAMLIPVILDRIIKESNNAKNCSLVSKAWNTRVNMLKNLWDHPLPPSCPVPLLVGFTWAKFLKMGLWESFTFGFCSEKMKMETYVALTMSYDEKQNQWKLSLYDGGVSSALSKRKAIAIEIGKSYGWLYVGGEKENGASWVFQNSDLPRTLLLFFSSFVPESYQAMPDFNIAECEKQPKDSLFFTFLKNSILNGPNAKEWEKEWDTNHLGVFLKSRKFAGGEGEDGSIGDIVVVDYETYDATNEELTKMMRQVPVDF